MTYEIYRYIFLGGAILAGIMFVVSVLVFFLLKIPTVIGDLTGANARKAIENIRNHNESTGDKTYRTSQVNRERGKLTDKISPSGRLIKDPSHSLHGAMGTEKISTQQLHPEDVTNETTVLTGELTGSTETTVLTGELTGANETTVLNNETHANETTALSAQSFSNDFVIEYEITYIHTDEVIAEGGSSCILKMSGKKQYYPS